jgi:ATP-dependent RNA helicase DDX46/PRP5
MDVYSMMTGSKGKSSFNPFGSNFVTLDDIVQQQQQSNGRSSVDRERSSSVANSDLGINETEAEREEREEREKKEFMEALRAARRQQEAVFKDSAPSSSASSIGRVYALDGEAGDESEATETRKSALELLEEQKKGKELKPVDHSKIGYLPFRKNLYIVPRALAKLSDEDVAAKREDLQIKVRGRGCPAPVDSWDQCGLSERILQQLQNLNLVAPFAIQKQAVPAIMCGRDVIGVAKTGSGKTMAFLLPMFRHVLDQPPLRDLDGPIGLIMAPARELAFQIFSECKKFTKVLGLRCGCIYGGAGVAEQIADIKRGMEIAVCTPGRLIDILCMQAGKLLSLQRVSMVVLDEADRMFDMGFEPQLRMVLQNVRPDRQTVLFSATFPKQIEALAKKVLKLPLEIIVGELAAGSVNKDITQIIEVHEESDKYLRLLQLLGTWYEKGSVLIFVDTQDKCDQLFQDVSTPPAPSLLALPFSKCLLVLTALFSPTPTPLSHTIDDNSC